VKAKGWVSRKLEAGKVDGLRIAALRNNSVVRDLVFLFS
jgi:hypothetical protein